MSRVNRQYSVELPSVFRGREKCGEAVYVDVVVQLRGRMVKSLRSALKVVWASTSIIDGRAISGAESPRK